MKTYLIQAKQQRSIIEVGQRLICWVRSQSRIGSRINDIVAELAASIGTLGDWDGRNSSSRADKSKNGGGREFHGSNKDVRVRKRDEHRPERCIGQLHLSDDAS